MKITLVIGIFRVYFIRDVICCVSGKRSHLCVLDLLLLFIMRLVSDDDLMVDKFRYLNKNYIIN